MALKLTIGRKEDIPADLASHYKAADSAEGGWILDVDGAVPKEKLDQFRENNVALLKEREDLQRKVGELDTALKAYSGTTPEDVASDRDALKRVSETATVAAQRAEAAEKALAEKQRELAEAQTKSEERLSEHAREIKRLAGERVQIELLSAAQQRGLRKTAARDLVSRAEGCLAAGQDGISVLGADGKPAPSARDAKKPMTLAEWIDQQVAEAPHLFESNAGGGAAGIVPGGSASLAGYTGANPFAKATWNLTRQAELQRNQPDLAVALKASAGPK